MMTQYGKMNIVVDPATGRATLDRRSGATLIPNGKPRRPTPAAGYDSTLEAARHRYWGYLLLAGEITAVIYHPFTIHLTEQLDYTPDFAVQFPDGRTQVEEVKGHLEMKNVRDSITRLKMAADRFPTWTWILTIGPKTRWTERYIGGRIPDPTPPPNHPRRTR
jgi:hypothetical protein